MKKFIFLISIFVFSILFVACRKSENSTQGNGGNEQIQNLKYEYDGISKFNFVNYENGTLILQIDGEDIVVNSSSYDVNSLSLPEGMYTINMYYYVNGVLQKRNVFYYENGSEQDNCLVSFRDENNELIKEVYLPRGSVFTETIFPKFTNKEGVIYSWKYDFELGKNIVDNVYVDLVATYTEYDVKFNLNGGSFAEQVETKYTIKSFDYTYPTPSKDGYIFDGWYENSDFNGTKVSTVNLLEPKNITLYAKWIEITQETKDVISIIKETLNADKLTITFKSSNIKREIAYDNSSATFYYHSITDDNPRIVVIGDLCYQYEDMTYYKEDINKDEYMDILSLTRLSEQIISTSVKKSFSKIKYTCTIKDSNEELIITTKDDKITKITVTNGSEEEIFKFNYSCSKLDVDKSKFTEKIFVNLYIIEIRDGVIPEFPLFQGKYGTKKGVKLNEVENINIGLDDINESFGGMYIDQAMTQEIDFNYVLNESVDIYWVDYGNFEEVLEVYDFTLNVHCDCSECGGGVKTYEDITYVELNNVKHFENLSDEHYELFRIVEEGKEILGWFDSPNDMKDVTNISKKISNHLFEKKYYEDLVIDIYTYTANVDTIKVKEVCNCDLHSELGYNEIYEIKGSWYWAWNNNHIKNGYMCEKLSLSEDLSLLEDGFELNEDTTIYYQWVEDTRVYVFVQSQENINGEYGEKYYGKAETLYETITFEYSGVVNGKIASGFYLDKDFTIPFTDQTILKDGDIIYIKWTEVSEVFLHTIDGNSEVALIPSDFDISNVDWSKYNGLIFNEESSSATDRIFKTVYNASQNSYEYVTLFEFYKDESRTQKITSFSDVTDVYLGFKEHPTVTIICDETCDMVHESNIYTSHFTIDPHQIMIGEDVYKINYYLDEDCTIKLQIGTYQYFYEDFIIYGKKELAQFDLNIDCNCLVHNSNIVGVFNTLDKALRDCDYGFGKGSELPVLYKDKEGNDQMNYGDEFLYDVVPNLYVLTSGKVKVYCSCNIDGHDGTGFDVVLINYLMEHQRTLEILEMKHRDFYMDVPTEYNVYLDKEMTNQIYGDYQLCDGENVYINIKTDENYIPVKIVYGDQYIEKRYAHKDEYYYLPSYFDKYNIVGYYVDSTYTTPVETIISGDAEYIIPSEISTIYCKLELAKIVTFTYNNLLGEEVVVTKYLIGDSRVTEFYSYLVPSYGYMSYVVDSAGNRVDLNASLIENETYKEKREKLEDYIVITIDCDCNYCVQEVENMVMILEDGSRINVVKNNTLLVKKGESAVPYLRECFSYHYKDSYSSDIREMNISLTKGGESLSTEIFDYYGSMFDSAPYYKYIYEEDTTLYLSFVGE